MICIVYDVLIFPTNLSNASTLNPIQKLGHCARASI